MLTLIKKFTFEAGHYLPGHAKCGTQHGHSWTLKVSVEGEINYQTGMVVDFSILKDEVWYYVLSKLDHKNLNDEFQFVPTCENLVIWIWEQLEMPLESRGLKLKRIKLGETADNQVAYYGENN